MGRAQQAVLEPFLAAAEVLKLQADLAKCSAANSER
jgi:hypothetical protein